MRGHVVKITWVQADHSGKKKFSFDSYLNVIIYRIENPYQNVDGRHIYKHAQRIWWSSYTISMKDSYWILKGTEEVSKATEHLKLVPLFKFKKKEVEVHAKELNKNLYTNEYNTDMPTWLVQQ